MSVDLQHTSEPGYMSILFNMAVCSCLRDPRTGAQQQLSGPGEGASSRAGSATLFQKHPKQAVLEGNHVTELADLAEADHAEAVF